MSIDRRIVSILYHNGIFDIEDVEKFVGEKDNYYEIIIDGELKKLQIPGYKYDELSQFEIEKKSKREELAEMLSQVVDENDNPYVNTEWVKEKILRIKPEISFEDEMKKNDDENTAFLEKIKEDEVQSLPKEEVKEIFKQPELEEVVEIKENKKLVVTKKEVKVTKPKAEKNVKIKKSDNDIDDFMNTI